MRSVILTIVFFLFFLQIYGQEKEKTPQTINELKAEIEKILEETKTPAVGIAMINNDSTIWIAGLGKADVEKNKQADENTMFRIGSISKMFVSLSILKLVEEGKLSLKDKVKDLIPEIEYTNKWEETNPILIEHLLEHTTGWDDLHLPEYGHNDSTPVTLKDGLDFHPHSRISRWVPGTRMSYCNSGPPVAAYIIQKITGERYEDYVQKHFFKPMGMINMTFFKSDTYNKLGATLYSDNKPQKYWHILMRPSGSINASPKNMANFVKFFINRCSIDSIQIISKNSLKRMETPATTSGAKAGLDYGYGLSNYTSYYKNFVFRGHSGGVNGGLTDFSYLPEHGVGYAIMINSGNGDALQQITELVRYYLTNNIKTKDVNIQAIENAKNISGFYVQINPRMQFIDFLLRILTIKKFTHEGDTIFTKDFLGESVNKYIPVKENIYAAAETGRIGLVKTEDPLEGDVMQLEAQVLKKVSPFFVYAQFIIGTLWVAFIVVSFVLGIIWLILILMKKVSGRANKWVRMWTFITSLFVILSVIFIILGMDNLFETLGKASFISVMIMILTICYGLSTALTVANVVKVRKAGVNKAVWWYSAIFSAIHLTITVYLLSHGVIGFQSWA